MAIPYLIRLTISNVPPKIITASCQKSKVLGQDFATTRTPTTINNDNKIESKEQLINSSILISAKDST
uniref:Uncharacterized protein MANES_05G073000 n=1 Tax=Rhizophora mucronata TaxID=61149 RepID=A0A2P2L2I5_RHIMU